MPRARKLTPRYLPHRQSGRARAVWTDHNGQRHERLLPGPIGSEESAAVFELVKLEVMTSPAAALGSPADATVNELFSAYLSHAEKHYRRADGTPTGETQHVVVVSRLVRQMYGGALAADFGPLRIKAVRARMIARGWCRRTVNQQIERIRRAFKWAASEELVPAAVYAALATVSGLASGRTEAPDRAPIAPVDGATVGATLPYLNHHVRGLVEFQRMTGARPGEACLLRRCDIDMTGPVWTYRPAHHKNAHRGKPRIIAIGPKAQALIREYLTPNLNDYLFNPARAVAELRAERAAKRATPRYPSHEKRNAEKRVSNPQRTPAQRYTPRSYSVAVARAVSRANKASAKKNGTTFPPLPHWHPNQLRHSFATRVRKEHGLEAAQVMLGHSRADVTQVYAERNEALAVAVAVKIG